MDSIAEQAVCTAAAGEMPKFANGSTSLQELFRQLAESVINAVMDAEAEEMCSASGNSRNGYRPRTLNTCVGMLNLRIPRFRKGSFFPDDILELCQRTDRALIAAVAEMYETGTSTRKVQRIAGRMGIDRLSKDQVSSMARSLDADVEELLARPLGGLDMPYIWLDATYVKCRREGHVSSTAIVTAIGCDADGWRHILGLAVVDTESHASWKEFLERIRERGVEGVQLVTSDAHEGLKRAISEVFLGAAWQRCAVHLMRDCIGAAGSRSLKRRVARIMKPVFRAKEADQVRALYHLAAEMLEECCPKAAEIWEEAEADALAYLDFPASHWKRLRTNNLERTNREIKRRTKVVQVFPSERSLLRLAGAVLAEQDEIWADKRYFSEERMAELSKERRPSLPPTPERLAELRETARKAIDASLELADGMETA
ncbi:MAG: IS256 family transposase [Atopobiaceae bacterium]|jgi:transposase-like protein|nr:IS256 family transposase [Atopobiaceae bacterium]